MSGTSTDGVDAVLADLHDLRRPRVLAHRSAPLADALRAELLGLNQSGPDEIHRACLAANALTRVYAALTLELLAQAGVQPAGVRAIGAHGQTVRHRPGEFDGTGYTVQLFNGALLAELTGIDVVCDLRSRDVAAGGQGAPLVPAVHAALFGDRGQASAAEAIESGSRDVAVLNVGGIANLTLLPAAGPVCGFDCGPGNVLMDLWCERHQRGRFDEDGRWAASGRVLPGLLASMQAEPFFARIPPKSTGRDLFHAAWLDRHLGHLGHLGHLTATGSAPSPEDVQGTLAELTAWAAGQALREAAGDQPRGTLLVCGGGAFNGHLMRRLQAQLPELQVVSTATRGVPPDQVEALAFAWLAGAFCAGQAGNLPAVTGARGPRVLGALYPAGPAALRT